MKTLLISLLLTTCALGQAPVPWYELNVWNNPHKNAFVAGVPMWSQVNDTWIVSTTPGNVGKVYPFVMANVTPDIVVIPGLKTSGITGADGVEYRFHDPGLWELIADAGIVATLLTGSSVVVLDNETLLKKFRAGNEEIDYAALTSAMRPLCNGIQWWFAFPHVREKDSVWPGRKAGTLQLTEAVLYAVPNAWFITPSRSV